MGLKEEMMMEFLFCHNETRSAFADEQAVEMTACLVFDIFFKDKDVFGMDNAAG